VVVLLCFLMIRRPPRSTLFPTRRSSDLSGSLHAHARNSLRQCGRAHQRHRDRKSTRLNSSHQIISYAVFCLKKNTTRTTTTRQSFRATSPHSGGRCAGAWLCLPSTGTQHRRVCVEPLDYATLFFFFNERAPPGFSPLPPPGALPI